MITSISEIDQSRMNKWDEKLFQKCHLQKKSSLNVSLTRLVNLWSWIRVVDLRVKFKVWIVPKCNRSMSSSWVAVPERILEYLLGWVCPNLRRVSSKVRAWFDRATAHFRNTRAGGFSSRRTRRRRTFLCLQ